VTGRYDEVRTFIVTSTVERLLLFCVPLSTTVALGSVDVVRIRNASDVHRNILRRKRKIGHPDGWRADPRSAGRAGRGI
jgi:hypothetical protein